MRYAPRLFRKRSACCSRGVSTSEYAYPMVILISFLPLLSYLVSLKPLHPFSTNCFIALL